MKKIIVTVIMLLMTQTCYADILVDLFSYIGAVDVSSIATKEPGTSIGVSIKEPEELISSITTFIKNNDDYTVLKNWTKMDTTTSCISFTDKYNNREYAACVNDNIVAFRTLSQNTPAKSIIQQGVTGSRLIPIR